MMSNWLEIHKNQWHVQKLTYIQDCMRLSKLRLFSYFDKYFYFIDLILMFHKWFAVRTYLYIFAWTFTSLFVFFHAVPCDGTVESKFGYLLCNFFFLTAHCFCGMPLWTETKRCYFNNGHCWKLIHSVFIWDYTLTWRQCSPLLIH